MSSMKTKAFADMTVEQACSQVGSDLTGLSQSEAESRLQKYGYNEISEDRRSPLIDLLSRYWGPMPWLLELTIILSLLLNHLIDAIVVFVLLTINVVVGFINSDHSQKALELLKSKLATKARVKRNGSWTRVDARQLVLGDVIYLNLGDVVPADAKVTKGELLVDQSSLTGESLPVHLHDSDVIFSGTVVTQGEGMGLVVNTGEATYFGATAGLVKLAKPQSHQMDIVIGVSRYLLYASLSVLAVTALYVWLTSGDMVLIVTFAVLFLMGSIPVALPAVTAIVEARGAMELSREGILVSRLDSIEDAASIDVLCFDKTGTLTQNRISVVDVLPQRGHDTFEVGMLAALASSENSKDLIDSAIIDYAKTRAIDYFSFKQTVFTPFTPNTKIAEAIVERGDSRLRVIKGAPREVLSRCKDDPDKVQGVEDQISQIATLGYRTLAVARSITHENSNLSYCGLIVMSDPIRPESKEMIERIRSLGVRPLMLTGDSLSIAKEVAIQTGIGEKIGLASMLRKESHNLRFEILDYDGFAEVYPEDKYLIVKSLQSQGHMLGMTGDGVNDAPALKQAEMGIAVKDATDVSKASASVVLTRDGIDVITQALITSRKIYQRMLSWVINKIAKVIQFVGLLSLGYFWLHGLVFPVIGMVLLIFSNDFATMSLATDNAAGSTSPNQWNLKNISILGGVVGLLLVAQGALTVYIGMTVFEMDLNQVGSLITFTLIFTSQFRILVVRERRRFWASRPGRELMLSVVGVLFSFSVLAFIGGLLAPLTLVEIVFAVLFSGAFTFIVVDPVKFSLAKRFGL